MDECYFGMGNITVVDLIDNYDNLIILRTSSKVMGIPSIRFGACVSSEKNIKRLEYNQNVLEADFMNTFSLLVFKNTFRYFEMLAEITNKFINEFIDFISKKFPEAFFYPL